MLNTLKNKQLEKLTSKRRGREGRDNEREREGEARREDKREREGERKEI